MPKRTSSTRFQRRSGRRAQGVKVFVEAIRSLRKKNAQGVQRGVTKSTLLLLTESQKLVPVDTGALKGSGLAVITGSGFGTRGSVEYTMPYAIYVHENLEANHPNGGQAKYLEQPARQLRGRISQIIREEARR